MLANRLSLLLKVHMRQRCVEKKEVSRLQLHRIGRTAVSRACRSIYAWHSGVRKIGSFFEIIQNILRFVMG